jgi:SAM-dependent methyltransferase
VLLGCVLGGVTCAILVSFTIGRLLGLDEKLALLVAVGNSICGNSAIAAVVPVIRADQPAGLRPALIPAPVWQTGVVVDRLFADARLAALYDVFCPFEGRGDFCFYLPLVMSAEAVLDVGCGTGSLLHRARQDGHTGRLCGLDPAVGMLEQARKRSDIEWILGDLASVAWDREFDLVIMTGHAFQVLVEDDELRASLAAIRAALTKNGRFAFETRNPLVCEWEKWTPDNAVEVADATGVVVRQEHRVETPVEGDIVCFTATYTSSSLDGPQVSRSCLRFLDAESLSAFLSAAGLAIEEQFGDWKRSALCDASPEIITVARRG